MICGHCRRVIVTDIIYFFDERFIVEKSDKQIPFCGAECSTKWMVRKKEYDIRNSGK